MWKWASAYSIHICCVKNRNFAERMIFAMVSVPLFSFTEFFTNATTSAKTIGGAFITFLGAIMVVVSGYQIAKALIGHGKVQTNWFVTIALLIVGGVFLFGGITMLVDLSQNLGEAVEGLGNGQVINQILPFLRS